MKIYQLCFPDRDDYPEVPMCSFVNIPSIDLLNNQLSILLSGRKQRTVCGEKLNEPIPKLNEKQYNLLISGVDVDLKLWAFGFYGNDCTLHSIDVIEN